MDVKKFDLAFIVDAGALIEGKFSAFGEFDFAKTKIRVFATEIEKFNAYYKGLTDATQKSAFKAEKINLLNTLINEKKMGCLNGTEADKLDYKLIEILLKKYFSQSILVISNDKNKADAYLPLVPVYEAFGQCLTVAKLGKDGFEEYSYECYDEAKKALVTPTAVSTVADVATAVVADEPKDETPVVPVTPVTETPKDEPKADDLVSEPTDVVDEPKADDTDDTVVVCDKNTDCAETPSFGKAAPAPMATPTDTPKVGLPITEESKDEPKDKLADTTPPAPVDTSTDETPPFTPVDDDEFDF